MGLNARRTKKAGIFLGILVCTFLVSLIVAYTTPLRQLELRFNNKLFALRGPIPLADSTIVLVSVSQQADQEIPYKYPWPTSYYAKLIENLNKAGAKAIGIDIVFDKQDGYSPDNDSLFARALEKYGNVVLAGNIEVATKARGGGSSSTVSQLIGPNALLKQANPNPMGLVKVLKDRDDEVRRYLLSMNYDNKRYYSMGLELLRLYNGWKQPGIHDGEDYFKYGSYTIPKYDPYSMAINYFGPPGSFPEYSFDTVIDDSTVLLNSEDKDFQLNSFSDPDFGLLQSGVFKDKIVLVGATMPELHDFHATPFASSGGMPGYETHANAIETILTGRYVYYASLGINLLLLAAAAFLIIALTARANAFWGFIFFSFLLLGTIGLALFSFLQYSYIIDVSAPLLAIVIGYLSTTSYEYITEQHEKRRIWEMFSSYVSPQLVNEMIESGQEPSLGGDEVYITAFFSDIESFSTFAEQLEPTALVELINEYLSAMTDILTEHGGTLDKYIGDAIVAFFGAPVPQEDHAYRACVVSQLMQYRLADLRKKWKAEGDRWPQVVHNMRNRIGINTGWMVTGNMGSRNRFNYTMMGDNVNLAARCESSGKAFGVYTLVTEETKKEAERQGSRCVFRYLDRIVVKGRTQAVDVYEIMGLSDYISEKELECRVLFELGIAAYKARQWNRAYAYFEQSAELEAGYSPEGHPSADINPSLVYMERCLHMQQHPPPEDWDGVFVMSTKEG